MAPPYAELAPPMVEATRGWAVVRSDNRGSGFGDLGFVCWGWNGAMGGLMGGSEEVSGGDDTKSALKSPSASAASRTSGSSSVRLLGVGVPS